MGTLLRTILFTCSVFVTASSMCYDGDKAQIEDSCKDYVECEENKWVRKSCKPLKLFDSVTLDCAWSWEVNCTEKSEDCDEGKLYADPNSCRQYYICIDKRLVLQTCPPLKVFDSSNPDSKSSPCRFGVTCDEPECTESDRRILSGDCNSYQKCINGVWKTETCPIGYNYNALSKECEMGNCQQCADGDSTTGKTCKDYFYCEGGIWIEKSCFLFHNYDPSQKKCVLFSEYKCSTAVSFLAEGMCAEGDLKPENDCSKYSVCNNGTWEPAACPEGFHFDPVLKKCDASDTADPHSCESYYTCEKGQSVKRDCGFMKEFDGVTKSCVYFNAHCFPGDVCTSGKVATDDCKVYEECIDGRYYKQTCGKSKIFDPEENKCVWTWPWSSCPKKTNRFVSPECPKGEIYDQKMNKCVVQKDTIMFSNGACRDGEREALDGECKKFNECAKGEFVPKSCSDCTNFHPEKKSCVFVWEWPCNPSGTTGTPATESDTPVTKPDTPATEPDTPATKPDTPSTEPDTPATEPDTPATKPDTPSTEPDTPATITTTTTTTQPSPIPMCTDGQKKPDKENCRKYYTCEKGEWDNYSCVWPWKFDSEDLVCCLWGAHCA